MFDYHIQTIQKEHTAIKEKYSHLLPSGNLT